MGCGCGGAKKRSGERVAQQRAAAKAQRPKRAGQDPRTYWNGPPKKASK